MPSMGFDDSNIKWYTLEGVDHAWYHIVNVQDEGAIVDVLFKFSGGERIVTHNHLADYSTLILQGELRIYSADGTLKEIRPVGSYTSRPAGGPAHTEGGGDGDVIALFSNRGQSGVIYEILGPGAVVVATLGFDDFKGLWQAQDEPVQPVIMG